METAIPAASALDNVTVLLPTVILTCPFEYASHGEESNVPSSLSTPVYQAEIIAKELLLHVVNRLSHSAIVHKLFEVASNLLYFNSDVASSAHPHVQSSYTAKFKSLEACAPGSGHP